MEPFVVEEAKMMSAAFLIIASAMILGTGTALAAKPPPSPPNSTLYEVPSMNRGPWNALYLHNYCTSYGYRGGLCYDPVYCWY
ncbi:unnamed protein product [Darwinula stevensoni]|uniref:Uncharacterized protein n=1 Tax=Darwinula stevensoni TaxID=69355 RepID=A0A7R9AAT0_9CRUS|nr:unnamed protein product [Darwinula stevensoni]CAG0898739.1 unnamed protein product [Darwinula stevensoni]